MRVESLCDSSIVLFEDEISDTFIVVNEFSKVSFMLVNDDESIGLLNNVKFC